MLDFAGGPKMTGKVLRVFLAATFLIVLLPASAGRAAQYDCGVRSVYFAGWGEGSSGVEDLEGTTASIETRTPDLCPHFAPGDPPGGTYFNDSSAWTMITPGSGAYTGWVQSGFVKRAGIQVQVLIEVLKQASSTACPDFCTYYLESLTNGSQHTHKQAFCSSCKDGHAAIQTIINGVVRNTTPWNPVSVWGPVAGWESQWAGETQRSSTDIGGDDALRVVFRNMQVQPYGGGAWHSPAAPLGVLTPAHPRALQSTINVNTFQMWCSVSCGPA